jgi:hypothetical protein
MLKAHGIKRLKLKYDELLSFFAFNFNSRRYIKGDGSMSRVPLDQQLKAGAREQVVDPTVNDVNLLLPRCAAV